MPGKCQSGKHAWTDSISAERCCHPDWSRSLRLAGDHDDLDLAGRVYASDQLFVHGWVRRRLDQTTPVPTSLLSPEGGPE